MCQRYFALLFLWKLAALGNKKACTVCQDLATDALTYLEKNKTREEIIIALHLHLQDLSKKVCRYSESSSSFKIPKYRLLEVVLNECNRVTNHVEELLDSRDPQSATGVRLKLETNGSLESLTSLAAAASSDSTQNGDAENWTDCDLIWG